VIDVRQIFYLDTESIYHRACELREFGDNGNITWRELYEWSADRSGMTAGELEEAVAEALAIPSPAKHGFTIFSIDRQAVVLQDAEESGTCDLTDADDSHMILPVTQFREWLYKWNADPLNRVMDTAEAAAIWGYDQADSVKLLCKQGKVRARKLRRDWIVDRNQPNPRVIPQRKWRFTFEDVQGSLTLGDDGMYTFEWGGSETTLTLTPAERDAFLKDEIRIGRVVNELAHGAGTE
jgi:hypothetical protein